MLSHTPCCTAPASLFKSTPQQIPFSFPLFPAPAHLLIFVTLYFSSYLSIFPSLLTLFFVTWFQKAAWASSYHFSGTGGRRVTGGQSQNFPFQGDWKSKTRFRIFVLSRQPISLPSVSSGLHGAEGGRVVRKRQAEDSSEGRVTEQMMLTDEVSMAPGSPVPTWECRLEGSWVLGSRSWNYWNPSHFLCLCKCELTYFL